MRLCGKRKLFKIKTLKSWPYKIKPNEIVSTEIGGVWINEDGILVMKYDNNLDFQLEKAKSAIKICEEMLNGNKALVMIFTGEFGKMPDETQKYLASKEVAKHRKAVALVINNLVYRLAALNITRMRSEYYPTEVFTDEAKALKWLKQQQ